MASYFISETSLRTSKKVDISYVHEGVFKSFRTKSIKKYTLTATKGLWRQNSLDWLTK
jgi:hypothetical protein